MSSRWRDAADALKTTITMADAALAAARRAFPDDKRYKGDMASVQAGLDQAWTAVRIMAEAAEKEEKCAGEGDA